MLKEIHVYCKTEVNASVADKIKKDIFSATNQLNNYPNSGSEEGSLESLGQNHRYLIVGNYKVTYKPVKEGVLITDVFGTRQNPIKINKYK